MMHFSRIEPSHISMVHRAVFLLREYMKDELMINGQFRLPGCTHMCKWPQ